MRSQSRHGVLCLVLALAMSLVGQAAADSWPTAAKSALWGDVDFQVSRLRNELGFHRLSPKVREALRQVPREEFVPNDQQSIAYLNQPVPIGYGQTMPQPLMVAIMAELLQIRPKQRVFELGTGSGYQTAILSALGAEVYSVEIVPQLGEQARRTLDRTGHSAVKTRVGDGYFGWESAAPFDAIVVTAAIDHIPPPLVQQVKPGGRMVIPVGDQYLAQTLVLVTRSTEGEIRTREILPVNFVPLTGDR